MQDNENKKPEYIWLVYNTSINSGSFAADYPYLFSAHRDFNKALIDKKECQAFHMADYYDSEETMQALKKFGRLKGGFEVEVVENKLGFTCYKVFRDGKTLACRHGSFYYNVFTEREARNAINGFLKGKPNYCLIAPDRIPEFK